MEKSRPGRALDEGLTARIQEAALQQILESGLEHLSLTELATKLGISRSTIYRRWPSKRDLAFEAFQSVADFGEIAVTDSLVEDLTHYMLLNLNIKVRADEEVAAGKPSFWGTILTFSVFPMYWDRFSQFHLGYAFQRVSTAMKRGELPPDTSPELLVAPLASFLIIRMVVDDQSQERRLPSPAEVRELVRSMCSDPPRHVAVPGEFSSPA